MGRFRLTLLSRCEPIGQSAGPMPRRWKTKTRTASRIIRGWSLSSLKYLYAERKITASGPETTDTDPGMATTKDDYSLETYILSTNHYQIELLTNLDRVPESQRRLRIPCAGICDSAVI